MDYAALIKKLQLPPGFAAPTRLAYEDLIATKLTRDDLHDDVRGINASIDLIRRTRGGSWPTEPVTEDFNYVDLVWHECEFREGRLLHLCPVPRRRAIPRLLLPLPDGTARSPDAGPAAP